MSVSQRKRECSCEKDFDPLSHKSKQICIPIEPEAYVHIMFEAQAFRDCLDAMIHQYPELFPSTIEQGYNLHDILPESKKIAGMRLRRIKVAAPKNDEAQVYTIRPSFVLPYMTGYSVFASLGGSSLGFGLRLWARRTVLVPA